MKGRPVRGFFAGLLLGIFVDLDLVFGGVVRLDSVVLTIVPPALVVVGLLLGWWAPLGRGATRIATGAPTGGLLPPPRAWPETAPTEGSTPSAPPAAPPSSAPPPPPI